MRDADIRSALEKDLREKHQRDPSVMIRHELGILEGRSRADLVVLNGEMVCYEIKSDLDTFVRLGDQANAYGQVFDFAHLVTTRRYADKALAVLPRWWGVLLVSQTPDGPTLETVRPGNRNVALVPMSLASLLWREEAIAHLRSVGAARGLSGRARWYVWQRLVEVTEPMELRHLVRETIKARPAWQADLLSPQGDGLSRRLATA